MIIECIADTRARAEPGSVAGDETMDIMESFGQDISSDGDDAFQDAIDGDGESSLLSATQPHNTSQQVTDADSWAVSVDAKDQW